MPCLLERYHPSPPQVVISHGGVPWGGFARELVRASNPNRLDADFRIKDIDAHVPNVEAADRIAQTLRVSLLARGGGWWGVRVGGCHRVKSLRHAFASFLSE
jgi:hypothetical protein